MNESAREPAGCSSGDGNADRCDDMRTRDPHRGAQDDRDDDDQCRVRSLRPHPNHQFGFAIYFGCETFKNNQSSALGAREKGHQNHHDVFLG